MERADGVPLFVEELTKSLIRPGAARDVEAIPATLADSLMARLDRLGTAKAGKRKVRANSAKTTAATIGSARSRSGRRRGRPAAASSARP